MIYDEALIKELKKLKRDATTIAEDIDLHVLKRMDGFLTDKKFKEITKDLWKFIDDLETKIDLVERSKELQ